MVQHTDLPFDEAITQVRCQGRRLQCGSVRIGWGRMSIAVLRLSDNLKDCILIANQASVNTLST